MRMDVLWREPGDQLVVRGEPGEQVLWAPWIHWRCQGIELRVRVIGAEPVPLPDPEPSEPPEGAIARLAAAVAGTGTQILLLNPGQAFGPTRISFCEGARLFAVDTEADLACWDAMLGLGQPVYGLRGRVIADVLSPHPASVLSSLAYGQFVCEDGLGITHLSEDRGGAVLEVERPAELCAVIRGGFETGTVSGTRLAWTDQGSEGSVRLVARAGAAMALTQPRFVAPRGKHA
jgi:hypothetical protein